MVSIPAKTNLIFDGESHFGKSQLPEEILIQFQNLIFEEGIFKLLGSIWKSSPKNGFVQLLTSAVRPRNR